MQASLTVNPDALADAKAEADRRLYAAALAYRDEHQTRLGVPYPPASQPGEYPRRRSGVLQASVVVGVQSPDLITVGYRDAAFYGMILEFYRSRLGLLQTLADTKPRLAAIIAGGR